MKYELGPGIYFDRYLVEVYDPSGPRVQWVFVIHEEETGTTFAEKLLEVSVSASYSSA